MKKLGFWTLCLSLASPALLGVGCKKKPADKAKSGAANEMGAMGAMGQMNATADRTAPRRPEDRRAARLAAPARDAAKEEVAPEAVLSEVKGTVEIKRSGQDAFAKAEKDAKVFAEDSVRAGKDGEAVLALWDNSSIELTPESALTMNNSDAIKAPSPSVTVLAGAVRFEVNPRAQGEGPFTVYTPTSVVNVQGTTLAVGVALSGAARVAVEEGKVELVPVATVTAKPIELPQGKVVVVPPKGRPLPLAAYKPDTWDDWLETEDAKAAKRADAVADAHAAQVVALAAEAEALRGAEEKAGAAGEDLDKKAAEAAAKKQLEAYKKLQPKLAGDLATYAAADIQRQFVGARLAGHAYLLALLRARADAGIYQLKPPQRARLAKAYARALRREQKRRLRLRAWRRHRRRRVRRLRRAYLLHSAAGRALAPRFKVTVPAFYAQIKLRRRLRRRAIRLHGYSRPLYRRPRYRGKRRAARGVALSRMRLQRNWYRNKMWRKRRRARHARWAARRAAWRTAVIARRLRRWSKRPQIRFRRGRIVRPGLRLGMGPGMGRGVLRHLGPGMGPGWHGRVRVGMGPGWHGRVRVGMEPFGMRIRRPLRRERRLRRGMRRRRRLRRHLRRGMRVGMRVGMQ